MAIMSQGTRTFYDGHTVTATSDYIYDSTNATSDEAGKMSSRYDYNVIQIGVPELAASCLFYRVEGRFNSSRWASVSTGTVVATTTIDSLITVSEKIQELRVGVYVGNEATPNVIYSSVCQTETR